MPQSVHQAGPRATTCITEILPISSPAMAIDPEDDTLFTVSGNAVDLIPFPPPNPTVPTIASAIAEPGSVVIAGCPQQESGSTTGYEVTADPFGWFRRSDDTHGAVVTAVGECRRARR